MTTRELDIGAIVSDIRKKLFLFLTVTGSVFVLTAVLLHFSAPKYTVTMVVGPITDSSNQAGGSLGALARLGGVNLAGLNNSAGQFRLFISALTTRDTADGLARYQNLMHRLFDNQWSIEKQRWKGPGLISRAIRTVKFMLGIPVEPWHPPNGEQVYELLSSSLQIDDDPQAPVVALRIQSSDPNTARLFLLKLADVVDSTLRARALARADGYIQYLNAQIGKTTVAEYRAALTAHLAEQEQTRMMASAHSVSFAAQIFSAPARSAQPTAPKSTMLLFLALVFGALLGGWLAVRAARRERAAGY